MRMLTPPSSINTFVMKFWCQIFLHICLGPPPQTLFGCDAPDPTQLLSFFHRATLLTSCCAHTSRNNLGSITKPSIWAAQRKVVQIKAALDTQESLLIVPFCKQMPGIAKIVHWLLWYGDSRRADFWTLKHLGFLPNLPSASMKLIQG